jgi:hypothetical protein
MSDEETKVRRYVFAWSEARGGYNCMDASASGLPLVLSSEFEKLERVQAETRAAGLAMVEEADRLLKLANELEADRDRLLAEYETAKRLWAEDTVKRWDAYEERDRLRAALEAARSWMCQFIGQGEGKAVDRFERLMRTMDAALSPDNTKE